MASDDLLRLEVGESAFSELMAEAIDTISANGC